MKYRLTVNDKELEVTLLERNGATLTFEVGGESYSASIAPVLSRSGTPFKKDSTLAASTNSIVAPMPGIIVSLSVSEGQKCSAGDTALVIEAMKMENNIPFTSNTVVSKIHVREGEEVESGQLLIELSPL